MAVLEIKALSLTQIKLLGILADGMPHSIQELHTAIPDELSSPRAVITHISKLRKVLRPKGEDIICEYAKRRRFYRQIRLLASATDGKR